MLTKRNLKRLFSAKDFPFAPLLLTKGFTETLYFQIAGESVLTF